MNTMLGNLIDLSFYIVFNINKECLMIESLKKILFTAIIFATSSLFAQTTITWTGTLGEVEAAVEAAGGEGEFVLEAGKIYAMASNISVAEGKVLKITGAEADGVQKASLQPFPLADGSLGFGGDAGPGEMFWTAGDGAEVHLDNLLLNGMAVNESGQVGIVAATGADNHIHVNDCIVTGVGALAFFTVGSGTDFTIRGNIVTNFTSYPGGAFYGGVVWGGGSWMGTMDMLIVENNTFQGVVGEAVVAYEYVEPGSKVDHNTFANVTMGAFYYYTANNLQITNNVFYNTRSWGQTRYDAGLNPVVDANGDPVMNDDGTQSTNGWGVVWPGGTGQLESRMKTLGSSACEPLTDADGNIVYVCEGAVDDAGEPVDADGDGVQDCALDADGNIVYSETWECSVDADGNPVLTGKYNMGRDGQEVDMLNRNVHWSNNAVVWSQGLIDWVSNHAGEDANGDGYGDTPCYTWTTTQTDADGNEYEVTVEDHQLLLAHQAVVHSDTTLNAVANNVGITASSNALLSDDEFRSLTHPLYLAHQLIRTDDFKDDQSTNGAAADHKWVWQPVDESSPYASHALLEYPLHLDCRYSATSAAATWSTTGGPVGDPRWVPHNEMVGTDLESVPGSFSLKQNYPNPFNPTTEIAFTLDNTSNISLTIFNALGQKVKVLVNESKKAGAHTVKWDGRDASGMEVSTGLYFYTLSDGNKSFTKKMALMK